MNLRSKTLIIPSIYAIIFRETHNPKDFRHQSKQGSKKASDTGFPRSYTAFYEALCSSPN